MDNNVLIDTSETTRLLWNSLRSVYPNYQYTLQINTLVRTTSLSHIGMGDDRLYRLELMKNLYDMGLSVREISEHLNHKGIRTPKGLAYYPKLVWVSLKKYMRRLDRDSGYERLSTLEMITIQKS